MAKSMSFSRHARGLLLLAICLLVVGALPVQHSEAATKDQPIDNTLADFARGSFQRTSLGAVNKPSIPSQKITDQNGAVQLGPIGLLRNWQKSPTTLPTSLTQMGTATLGNRIFVIGGLDANSNRLNQVWARSIDISNGTFTGADWDTEPRLADVIGSRNQTSAVSTLSSPAIAAVDKPGGGGYIYVIGGEVPQAAGSFRTFSSYAVQRATVGADGHLVRVGDPTLNIGFQELANAKIPSPDPNNVFLQRGLLGASAVVYKSPAGRVFIYLIGGLEQYLQGGSTVAQQGTRRVWYAEVNLSNGLLYKPSTNGATEGWEQLTDIPLPNTLPASGGLWNTVAVADHFLTTVNGTNDALYVIGGLNVYPATASQVAYRALISPSTGALTWTPKANSQWFTLPQARSGHGGAIFRGNIYLTSGQEGGSTSPDASILTTYVEDNLDLHNFGGQTGSDFLENPSALACGGTNPGAPRTGHGTILVPAGPTAPNTAFLYILGGRGALPNAPNDCDTTDDQGSDDIIMAKIGGDEDIKNAGYAQTGEYYSAIYPISFNQAEVQQISWATLITRTGQLDTDDIALDYRISNDADCSRPTWDQQPNQGWQSLDALPADPNHASNSGLAQNSYDFVASVPAKCFQYRATLFSSADLLRTPSLLNVSIKIFIPGSPDLSPQSLTALRGANNALTGLNVLIQNVYKATPIQPTLAADIDGGGSFYVDLCIFKPGQAVIAPTIPNPACTTAYAMVNKSVMTAGLTNYPVSGWLDFANDKPVNLLTFFKTPGTYTVFVVVDSTNFVPEAGAEDNNISQPYSISVPGVQFASQLPLVRR